MDRGQERARRRAPGCRAVARYDTAQGDMTRGYMTRGEVAHGEVVHGGMACRRLEQARRGLGAAAGLASLAALCLASACSGCEGPRVELAEVPDIDYPLTAEPVVEVERVLRSGSDMRDQTVVERFSLLRAGEHRVARTRQEWPLGTSDIEVLYDAAGQPVRVWRRTTIPDASGPVGHVDVRIYDLVTDDEGVRIARRGPAGELEGTLLRGARPTAVISAGRGTLSPWLQRAELEVGERTREPVLDVREPLALIREVTLERQPDREMDDLGTVRVYTIYGREPVFADEDDVVVGDMLGLREASVVPGEIPDPMPDPGPFAPETL